MSSNNIPDVNAVKQYLLARRRIFAVALPLKMARKISSVMNGSASMVVAVA